MEALKINICDQFQWLVHACTLQPDTKKCTYATVGVLTPYTGKSTLKLSDIPRLLGDKYEGTNNPKAVLSNDLQTTQIFHVRAIPSSKYQ
jgi:hypothetical protein